MSRHPITKWAQRSDRVFLTIELPDAQDVKLNLKPEGHFNFSAKGSDDLLVLLLTAKKRHRKTQISSSSSSSSSFISVCSSSPVKQGSQMSLQFLPLFLLQLAALPANMM
uniref:Co-chaperone protein p23 n=1 Tax=Zea mays TaxID=4577 RepID=B6U9M8_MAIZE|nr:hypothetical protein [Zea mays]